MKPSRGAGSLLAILANPSTGTGARTTKRVHLAAQLLGFDEVIIDNVFPVASHTTNEIAALGADPDPWIAARSSLSDSMKRADCVLLGYGCKRPAGQARHHFDSQIEWILEELRKECLDVWMVGERPHHPSRWQRYTARTFPDLDFDQALPGALTRIDPFSALLPRSKGQQAHRFSPARLP